MNILLVHPRFPDSFWSFKYALRFISKKATLPPLGLITVSAMLPGDWNKKLIDMNVSKLKDKDILWADYVFIGAMQIQRESVGEVLERCRQLERKTVAGGPLFTQESHNYIEVDHLILNEAEVTLPVFLEDLANGKAEKIYKSRIYPEITATPIPDYHLLDLKKYAFMNLQVSRGCPFNCEFCEITPLFGHKVRLKTPLQVTGELQRLYDLKWRGNVFIVDDNFIGNISAVKHGILPAIRQWMEENHFPFIFNTEVSINLADDPELMQSLSESGFNAVFIGIETPEDASLEECSKVANKNRDLLQSIRKIHESGLHVSAGFIVGFDSDPPTVFQRQIDFIQKSGIVSAMVGLLNAPKNTRLYHRLKAENRLISDYSGNNTDLDINFKPRMNYQDLIAGYKKVLRGIYDIRPYYQRIRQLLTHYKPNKNKHLRIQFRMLLTIIKSFIILGLIEKGRSEYWKLLIWTLFRRPSLIPDAIEFSIYGFHYRKIYKIGNQNRNTV